MADADEKRLLKKKSTSHLKNKWLSNVTRSLGGQVTDTISKMIPNISAINKQTSDEFSSISKAVANPSKFISDMKKGIASNSYINTAQSLLKNALSDIKSGNINNTTREDKAMESMFGGGGGSSSKSDDFDFDDDSMFGDFDYDDEYDDSSVAQTVATEENTSVIQSQTEAIKETGKNSTIIVSGAINKNTESTIVSSQAMVNAILGSTASVSSAVMSSANSMLKSLHSQESSLANIVEFNNSVLKEFIEKSTSYLEKQGSSDSSDIDIGSADYDKDKNNPFAMFDYSSGVIDFSKYAAYVKKGLGKNAIKNSGALGMVLQMLEDPNNQMVKMLVANPVGMISSMAIDAAIPAAIKASLESVDKTFGSFIPALFMKIGNEAAKMTNPIGKIIASSLGFNASSFRVNNELDLERSKLSSKAVPFDDMTRNSITNIIPRELFTQTSLLREIASKMDVDVDRAYTNAEVFSYDKNRYSTRKNVNDAISTQIIESATGAWNNTDIGDVLEELATKFQTDTDRQAMQNVIREFQYIASSQPSFIDPTGRIDSTKYKNLLSQLHGPKSFVDILDSTMMNAVNQNRAMGISKAVLGGANNINNILNEIISDPVANNLYESDFVGNKNINAILRDYFAKREQGEGDGYFQLDNNDVRLEEITKKYGDKSSLGLRIDELRNRIRKTNNAFGTSMSEEEEEAEILKNLREEKKNSIGSRKLSTDEISNYAEVKTGHLLDEAKAEDVDEEGFIKRVIGKNGFVRVAGQRMNNIMYSIIFGSNEDIKQQFQSIAIDISQALGGTIIDKVISPTSRALFGTKVEISSEDGRVKTSAREDGILAGISNKISDTVKKIKYQIDGKEYIDSSGTLIGKSEDEKFSIMGTAKSMVKDIYDTTTDEVKTVLFGADKVDEDGNVIYQSVTKVDRKTGKEETKEVKVKESDGILGGTFNWLRDKVAYKVNSHLNYFFGKDDDSDNKSPEETERAAKLAAREFRASASEWISDKLPSGIKGGLAGALGGTLLGNSLFGSIIGGPLVGAALGSAAGIASKSEKFNNWLFGEEYEDNEGVIRRAGGLISQKFQESIKGNKKALIASGTLGAIGGSAFLNLLPGNFGVVGQLVGGPIGGAAVAMGTTLLAKSNMFHEFIFGKENADGDIVQTGVIDWWKRAWGSVKLYSNEDEDKTLATERTMASRAVGGTLGFLSASLLSKMGFIPAFLGPAGPIGGALLGLAASIAHERGGIRKWLFGTQEDSDTPWNKVGLFGQFKNMLEAHVIRPVADTATIIMNEASHFVRYDVLDPIRQLIYPVVRLGKRSIGLVGKLINGIAIKTFDFLKDKGPFGKIFNAVSSFVDKATATVLFTTMERIKTPFRILGNMTRGVGQIAAFIESKISRDPSAYTDWKKENTARAFERKRSKADVKASRLEISQRAKNRKLIAKYTRGGAWEDTDENRMEAELQARRSGKTIKWFGEEGYDNDRQTKRDNQTARMSDEDIIDSKSTDPSIRSLRAQLSSAKSLADILKILRKPKRKNVYNTEDTVAGGKFDENYTIEDIINDDSLSNSKKAKIIKKERTRKYGKDYDSLTGDARAGYDEYTRLYIGYKNASDRDDSEKEDADNKRAAQKAKEKADYKANISRRRAEVARTLNEQREYNRIEKLLRKELSKKLKLRNYKEIDSIVRVLIEIDNTRDPLSKDDRIRLDEWRKTHDISTDDSEVIRSKASTAFSRFLERHLPKAKESEETEDSTESNDDNKDVEEESKDNEGYAKGTLNATPGVHEVGEGGDAEYIRVNKRGLYNFNGGETVLPEKLLQDTIDSLAGLNEDRQSAFEELQKSLKELKSTIDIDAINEATASINSVLPQIHDAVIDNTEELHDISMDTSDIKPNNESILDKFIPKQPKKSIFARPDKEEEVSSSNTKSTPIIKEEKEEPKEPLKRSIFARPDKEDEIVDDTKSEEVKADIISPEKSSDEEESEITSSVNGVNSRDDNVVVGSIYSDDGKSKEETFGTYENQKERKYQSDIQRILSGGFKQLHSGINRVGDISSEHSFEWQSIFSKKGLITAGILLLAPAILKLIKNVPMLAGMLEGIGGLVAGVASLVVKFGATGIDSVVDLIKEFGWSSENNALTNGETSAEASESNVSDIKALTTGNIGEFITGEDGEWDSQSKSRATLIANAGRKGVKIGGTVLRATKPLVNTVKEAFGKDIIESTIDPVTMTEKATKSQLFKYKLGSIGSTVSDKLKNTGVGKFVTNTASKVTSTATKVKTAANGVASKVLTNMEKKAAEKFTSEATEKVSTSTIKTVVNKVKDVLTKGIKSLVEKFVEKTGAKVADKTGGKFLKELLSILAKKISDIPFIGKLAAKVGIRLVAAPISMIFSDPFGFLIGAIDGATAAAKLFQVNKEDVDGRMTLISVLIGGLSGTTIGSILAVFNDLFEDEQGVSILNKLARFLYNLISSSEDKEELDTAHEEFQNEYLEAQQKAIEESYNTYKEIYPDATITLEEYKEKVNSGELDATYESFADYNKSVNASVFDTIGAGISKVGGYIADSISTLTGNAKYSFKVDEDNNVYYKRDSSNNKWIAHRLDTDEEIGEVATSMVESLNLETKTYKKSQLAWRDSYSDYQSGASLQSLFLEEAKGNVIYYSKDSDTFFLLATENEFIEVNKNGNIVTKGITVDELYESNLYNGSLKQYTIDNNTKEKNVPLAVQDVWKLYHYSASDSSLSSDGTKYLSPSLSSETSDSVREIEEAAKGNICYVDETGYIYYIYSGDGTFIKYNAQSDKILSRDIPIDDVYTMLKSKNLNQVSIDTSSTDNLTKVFKETHSTDSSGFTTTPQSSTTDATYDIDREDNTTSSNNSTLKASPSSTSTKSTTAKSSVTTTKKSGSLLQTVGRKVADVVGGIGDTLVSLFGGNNSKSDAIPQLESHTTSSTVSALSGGGFGTSSSSSSNVSEVRTKQAITSLPYYSQDDSRWASMNYSNKNDSSDSDTFANAGCGPTALAMATNILGSNKTPADYGRIASKYGYRDNTGTNWNFMNDAPIDEGYYVNQSILPNSAFIDSELSKGRPIVLSGMDTGREAGDGYRSVFTNRGHYVTIVGKDSLNNVLVEDPRGRNYSGAFPLNKVLSETTSAWSISRNMNDNVKDSTSVLRLYGTSKVDSDTINRSQEIFTDAVSGGFGDQAALGMAAVNWMLTIYMRNNYSQGSRESVEAGINGTGSGDCSSTCRWAYTKASGGSIDIGSYTGAQWNNLGVLDVVDDNNGDRPNLAALIPGDLIFYKATGTTNSVAHVEMYIGNGLQIGHGAGVGPKVSTVEHWCNGEVASRRYLRTCRVKAGLINNIVNPDGSLLKISYNEALGGTNSNTSSPTVSTPTDNTSDSTTDVTVIGGSNSNSTYNTTDKGGVGTTLGGSLFQPNIDTSVSSNRSKLGTATTMGANSTFTSLGLGLGLQKSIIDTDNDTNNVNRNVNDTSRNNNKFLNYIVSNGLELDSSVSLPSGVRNKMQIINSNVSDISAQDSLSKTVAKRLSDSGVLDIGDQNKVSDLVNYLNKGKGAVALGKEVNASEIGAYDKSWLQTSPVQNIIDEIRRSSNLVLVGRGLLDEDFDINDIEYQNLLARMRSRGTSTNNPTYTTNSIKNNNNQIVYSDVSSGSSSSGSSSNTSSLDELNYINALEELKNAGIDVENLGQFIEGFDTLSSSDKEVAIQNAILDKDKYQEILNSINTSTPVVPETTEENNDTIVSDDEVVSDTEDEELSALPTPDIDIIPDITDEDINEDNNNENNSDTTNNNYTATPIVDSDLDIDNTSTTTSSSASINTTEPSRHTITNVGGFGPSKNITNNSNNYTNDTYNTIRKLVTNNTSKHINSNPRSIFKIKAPDKKKKSIGGFGDVGALQMAAVKWMLCLYGHISYWGHPSNHEPRYNIDPALSGQIGTADCSSATRWCYLKATGGLNIGWEQREAIGRSDIVDTVGTDYQPVPANQLIPGDLVYYYNKDNGDCSHVGMYIGNNLVMDVVQAEYCPNNGYAPRIINYTDYSFNNASYINRHLGVRRMKASAFNQVIEPDPSLMKISLEQAYEIGAGLRGVDGSGSGNTSDVNPPADVVDDSITDSPDAGADVGSDGTGDSTGTGDATGDSTGTGTGSSTGSGSSSTATSKPANPADMDLISTASSYLSGLLNRGVNGLISSNYDSDYEEIWDNVYSTGTSSSSSSSGSYSSGSSSSLINPSLNTSDNDEEDEDKDLDDILSDEDDIDVGDEDEDNTDDTDDESSSVNDKDEDIEATPIVDKDNSDNKDEDKDSGGFGETKPHMTEKLNGATYISQSDQKYKNIDYSDPTSSIKNKFEEAGCAPAAISMALGNVGVDTDPISVAKTAQISGYRDYTGTNSQFVSNYLGSRGVNVTETETPDDSFIDESLNSGRSVIVSGMRTSTEKKEESPYTSAGHYVTVVGKDSSGKYIVNDPRGKSYSKKYDKNTLINHATSGWSIGKNGGFGERLRHASRMKRKNLIGGFGSQGDLGMAAVNWMLTIYMRNNYSQGARDNVEAGISGTGSGDCSSTCRWAYTKASGGSIDIGSYTGAQWNNLGVVDVVDDNNGSRPNLAALIPGDLIFYKAAGSANSVAHVEMYIGNGLQIGHGSGVGPKISTVEHWCNGEVASRQYLRTCRVKAGLINNIVNPDGSLLKISYAAALNGGAEPSSPTPTPTPTPDTSTPTEDTGTTTDPNANPDTGDVNTDSTDDPNASTDDTTGDTTGEDSTTSGTGSTTGGTSSSGTSSGTSSTVSDPSDMNMVSTSASYLSALLNRGVNGLLTGNYDSDYEEIWDNVYSTGSSSSSGTGTGSDSSTSGGTSSGGTTNDSVSGDTSSGSDTSGGTSSGDTSGGTPSVPQATPVNGEYLGTVSQQMESGTQGSRAVDFWVGPDGGATAGTWQFTWAYSIPQFWQKYGYDKTFPLPDPKVDQAGFKSQWLACVDNNPSQFFANEHQYTIDAYYSPARNLLANSGGVDPDANSKGMQEATLADSIRNGSHQPLDNWNHSSKDGNWMEGWYARMNQVCGDGGRYTDNDTYSEYRLVKALLGTPPMAAPYRGGFGETDNIPSSININDNEPIDIDTMDTPEETDIINEIDSSVDTMDFGGFGDISEPVPMEDIDIPTIPELTKIDDSDIDQDNTIDEETEKEINKHFESIKRKTKNKPGVFSNSLFANKGGFGEASRSITNAGRDLPDAIFKARTNRNIHVIRYGNTDDDIKSVGGFGDNKSTINMIDNTIYSQKSTVHDTLKDTSAKTSATVLEEFNTGNKSSLFESKILQESMIQTQLMRQQLNRLEMVVGRIDSLIGIGQETNSLIDNKEFAVNINDTNNTTNKQSSSYRSGRTTSSSKQAPINNSAYDDKNLQLAKRIAMG